MTLLKEQDFRNIKETILDGRLNQSRILAFLIGNLVFTGGSIGIALLVANANTIGWETLSDTWHFIFYAEAILFTIHFLLILLGFINSHVIHKFLIIMMVLFSYKLVIDPFIAMLMFAKDVDAYEIYLPPVISILVIGFLLHFVLVFKKFHDIRQVNNQNQAEKKSNVNWIIIFFFVVLTGLLLNSGILGANDMTFGLLLFTALLIVMLIGAVEFVLAAYCVIRFPSFLDSSSKKVQIQKKKKRKR